MIAVKAKNTNETNKYALEDTFTALTHLCKLVDFIQVQLDFSSDSFEVIAVSKA